MSNDLDDLMNGLDDAAPASNTSRGRSSGGGRVSAGSSRRSRPLVEVMAARGRRTITLLRHQFDNVESCVINFDKTQIIYIMNFIM